MTAAGEQMAPVEITVKLTRPQIKALHELLSVIENDPDWTATMGATTMRSVYSAHNRMLLARREGVHSAHPAAGSVGAGEDGTVTP